MSITSFDQYWAANWTKSGQPEVMDGAFREVAMKAWNAATHTAAQSLQMQSSDIRLMAGELSAGEMRTTKAVMSGCEARIRRMQVSQ